MEHAKLKNGFTLVELMICIAIIGILAATAMSGYRRYVAEANRAEGVLRLRTAYDNQMIYVSSQPLLAPDRKTSCQPSIRFAPFTSFISTRQDCVDTAYAPHPPIGKKAYNCVLGLKPEATFTTSTCDLHGGYALHGTLHALGSASANYGVAPGDYGTSPFTDAAGYFATYAGRDANIAAEYSVDINNTITIFSVADTDGDYSGAAITRPPLIATNNPINQSTLWTLARSAYINSEGEPTGTAGIFESNKGE